MSCDRTWRWRWDSNPRWSCPHTRFRGVLLWPLGHATESEDTRPTTFGANSGAAWGQLGRRATRIPSTTGAAPHLTRASCPE